MLRTWLGAMLLAAWAPVTMAAWHADEQPIMGTRVHVDLWLADAAAAQSLLERCMAEMRRIEAAFSPYIEQSELSRLNREAPHGWVRVSDELYDLLAQSQRMSELSDGAFDITYASVGRFYDYRESKRPSAAERAAVAAIDYRYVELAVDPKRVRYRHPSTYIDLGGIAKGHAVDRVAAMMLAAGVAHGSVSAGGDSRILGDRRGKPWAVGVQDPRNAEKMAAILPLVDAAVSTSGDYERYFEADGVRYHHILDPNTGDSARGAMSVTVLGTRAALTDALSTTIFVLGPERGLEFAARFPEVDVILIDPEGRMRFSAGLEEMAPAATR